MANIDHVGIVVSSIKQARRLYEALGLTVLEEKIEDEGVRSVMIPLGESRLRLIESGKKETGKKEPQQKEKEGLNHLALHVDDISAAFEELKKAGIRLLSDEIEIGAGGRLHFLVDPADSHGLSLEICQDPIAAV
jgi:methylmalonyl-CoA/ethylmalonyl-CoA epimerase